MAAIAPGLGGTFKQSTAEGRALEVLVFLQLAEKGSANNPDSRNNVSGSFDEDEGVYTATYAIPATQTVNNQGQLVLSASPYLQGVEIDPGSDNPTFKSTVPEAYLLEVLMYLQNLERNPAKNPQNRNAVTGNYNSDTGIFSGVVALPVTLSLAADGSISISAQAYLST